MTGRVFLGLGSNLGDRGRHLDLAAEELARLAAFTPVGRSRCYRSEALGDPGGPPFLNAVAAGLWTGTPLALLAACRRIERAHGRRRPYRNAPRTLDIDILFWEGFQSATAELTVPHPRLLERAFALVPLLELAPDLVHPATGRPLASYLGPELRAQGLAVHREEAPVG